MAARTGALGEMNRALAALLLVVACTQEVDRDQWQRMSASEKRVYVSSLLGGEKAKEAKGGGARRYSAAVETYVMRIDRAYASGDRRDPPAIFVSLADRP